MMRSVAALVAVCGACGSRPVASPVVSPPAARVEHAAPSSEGMPEVTWRDAISSPRAAPVVDPALVDLLPTCGTGEESLHGVAKRLARRLVEGRGPLDMGELALAIRAEGGPHVWPRAWTLEGETLDPDDAHQRLRRFLASFGDGGERRCGLAALRDADRTVVLTAIVVDALADLAHVPVRTSVGQWIDVDAALLVPATEAKVIVLGPRGAPRAVPTSLHENRVRARFRIDQPGAWIAQVLAVVATGPRPVAEATLFAEVEPPTALQQAPAPGEAAGDGLDDESAIHRMIDAARATEGSPLLHRDPRLDTVARAHADAMRRAGIVGHDVGGGDPRARVEAAGIAFAATGENVARARSLAHAHRALWASPSHRENLLLPRFDSVGVGVVRDRDGSVWLCEVFADF